MLLLDTHAYVWATSQPDRLSPSARTTITDPGSRLLVSAASVWEMAIKHRAGKWPEAEAFLAGHAKIIGQLGAQHLEISWEHARRAGGLRWSHADPFDRMLAAQSMAVGASFVTRDPAFEDVVGLDLLW